MRTRSKKLILATSLAVVFTAILAGVASAGIGVQTDTQQPTPTPTSPSDSAAFPGGGTVSVPGVAYPKGTAAPSVGSLQSGPSPEDAQKTTVDSSPSGTPAPGRPRRLPSVRRWCPQRYGNLLSCIQRMKIHAGR
jgi:hypothetical protein